MASQTLAIAAIEVLTLIMLMLTIISNMMDLFSFLITYSVQPTSIKKRKASGHNVNC
jgi:hypothetical protein